MIIAPVVRPPLRALLFGFCIALLGAVAVASCRLPFTPTPAECAAGRVAGGLAWLVGMGAAIIVAAGSAGFARRSRRGATAGPFGSLAAIVLAAGLPLLAVAWRPTLPAAAVGACAAVCATPFLLPLLRERGLWSLAIATVLAVTPHLWAWRLARLAAHAATPIAAAIRAVAALPPDSGRVALLLDRELDPAVIDALSIALWPRQVLAARVDAVEGLWLARMELPVIRCGPSRAALQPRRGGDQLSTGELQVVATMLRDAGGAVTSMQIRCERARAGYLAVVYGPGGALLAEFAVDGRASLDGAAWAQLQHWLQPLPSATPIRVLVVPPGTADVHGWTELP